jgi:hypothetical protein
LATVSFAETSCELATLVFFAEASCKLATLVSFAEASYELGTQVFLLRLQTCESVMYRYCYLLIKVLTYLLTGTGKSCGVQSEVRSSAEVAGASQTGTSA